MANKAEINLENWIQGRTIEAIPFRITLNEAPINLVGATIESDFRKEATGDAYLELSSNVDGGITITDGTDGKFQFDEINECPLEPGTYYYDIKFTLSNGKKYTYIFGKVTVEQSLTY